MKQSLFVIMKPTLNCNLQCRHCYHIQNECSKEQMSEEILEKTIKLVKQEYDSAWYIWHGGEPLLAGEGFFKKVFSLQKKYYEKAINRCGNTIQTNGVLLNPKFIELCKNHRINIGVSTEGKWSSMLRPNVNQNHIDEMLEYMVKKKHMFSVTSSIYNQNVNEMNSIFDYFNSKNISFNFSPVLKIGNGLLNEDLHLFAETYIEKSIEVFDRWLYDKNSSITVIPFGQYVNAALTAPNVSDCAHSSCLTKWICVYPNGDVYPCGKPCPEEFKLGNIMEINSIEELFKSEGFRKILIGSIERRNNCSTCEIYDKCAGGCSVDAHYEGNIAKPDFFSCTIFKGVYSHISKTINEIIENKEDLSQLNPFVKNAIIGKLSNPNIVSIH